MTNLLQTFAVTNITQTANGTSITFPSCQYLRYLIWEASVLTTNTQWLPIAYIWGQPNHSWTTWTDTTATDPDGYTVTARFYRVQRILGSTLAAGAYHGLAALTNGSLWGWGENYDGQVGDGTTSNQDQAVLVAPDPCAWKTPVGTIAVAGSQEHSVAVDQNGAVWTWGSDADVGELGNGGTSLEEYTPSMISGISNVVSVAAGYDHTLALTANRTVWAWGDNNQGELGIGGPPPYTTNWPVTVATQIVAIAAGDYFSVAVDAGGNVWAWGYGDDGEIGNGGGTNASTPTLVTNISNVIAVAAGDSHVAALTSSNTVWTWGDNSQGELGLGFTGGNETVPVQVPGLSNIVAITAGYDFTLAVTANGLVYGWGYNDYGELGTNYSVVGSTNLPMLVTGISNVVQVAANSGGYTSLAMALNQGTNVYWGWGYDYDGEVGNGTDGINQYSPAQVEFASPPSGCSCYQLGTNGAFTAQSTGTLYLFFNDDDYGDNTQSYTVTIAGLTSNVPVLASNYMGVAVGSVTNGQTYTYTASGLCLHCNGGNNGDNCPSDANGTYTNGVAWDCSNNMSGFTCPSSKCYSLVGKIE